MDSVGGIIGRMGGGVLGNCGNEGKVGIITDKDDSEGAKIGGACGILQVGGIAAGCDGPSMLRNCYNTGDILGDIAYTGGIAGRKNFLELKACYTTGNIFQKLGYMESSSSDLFDQFLKTGMGAKPLIAGYENQLLEFAVENPDTWEQIKGDIVMMYPTPTVWSSHVYIALDEAGAAGIDALLDEDIQRLAWEKHGFRTGVYDTPTDAARFGVSGIAEELTQVAPMPDANTMDRIIKALS